MTDPYFNRFVRKESLTRKKILNTRKGRHPHFLYNLVPKRPPISQLNDVKSLLVWLGSMLMLKSDKGKNWERIRNAN